MLYGNMDYFIAIVECGSLTRAAEQLYVSQPYLSQYLKRLEDKLGVDLFDRGSSPLRLTYSGERYYRHLLQVRQMNEQLRREFQDIQNQVSGVLRLGVALWRGSCLLPDVFPDFHEKYPDIHMELLEGPSDQLTAALMSDKIDLAVTNIPHNLDYSKFVCDVIMEEKILLAAPTGHPVVQRILGGCSHDGTYPVAPVGILREIPLVLTGPGQNLTVEITCALNRWGIEPEILMHTANLTTAINLCAKGVCCAFVPEEGAEVCTRSGEVTCFSLSGLNLTWDLAVLYKRGAYLNNLAKLFVHELKQKLGSGTGAEEDVPDVPEK